MRWRERLVNGTLEFRHYLLVVFGARARNCIMYVVELEYLLLGLNVSFNLIYVLHQILEIIFRRQHLCRYTRYSLSFNCE